MGRTVSCAQSRGADHHGLSAGTAPEVAGAEYVGYVDQGPIMSVTVEQEDGTIVEQNMGGAIMLRGNVSSFTFSYSLVAVEDDRDKTEYYPPSEHLGKPLTDNKPANVAQLAILFYESLLADASKFIKG